MTVISECLCLPANLSRQASGQIFDHLYIDFRLILMSCHIVSDKTNVCTSSAVI